MFHAFQEPLDSPDPTETLDATDSPDLRDLPDLPDPLDLLDRRELPETPDSPDSPDLRENVESAPSTALWTEESSSRTEPGVKNPKKLPNFARYSVSGVSACCLFAISISNKRFSAFIRECPTTPLATQSTRAYD